MKKKWGRGNIFFLLVLMVALQMVFILVMRNSPSTNHEQGRHETERSSKRTSMLSWWTIVSMQRTSIVCDRSNEIYDWCFLNRPTILVPRRSTFFAMNMYTPTKMPPLTEKVRPYPRKWETIITSIKEISLSLTPIHTSCDVYHNSPALVFSTGGYTGNLFHDFNDGIIPLYVTINTLFHKDQDVVLVISDFKDWWNSKYETILPQFSKHPIINLDNQTMTHCFPRASVGLFSHGPMTIDPSMLPTSKTFLDFRSLLGAAYNKCNAAPVPPLVTGKPRLVFVTRAGTVGRVIRNQDSVLRTTKEEGFDVVVFSPNKFTYLCDVYKLINTSHAVFGVHGAALTHSLFLRPGAVLMQVVPLGNEWLAEKYFRNMAINGMKLEYMEYKVRAEESSLAEKYGNDHVIVRRAKEIASRNWTALDTVYLKGQDVRLDVERLRDFLKVGYVKAKRFMDDNG
ncbi:hypothetical protein Droror1_Dr00003480 [Drosera rotundifolia]